MSDAPDLIDMLAGLAPGSPLSTLRAERPEVVRHTEGAYQALFEPVDPGGLSQAERAAIAWEVATHHDDTALAAHYSGLLPGRGGTPAGPRWEAIDAQVEIMSLRPRHATPGALDKLRAAGLGEREIVTLAQIVAFVSYQSRVLTGLKLMERAGA